MRNRFGRCWVEALLVGVGALMVLWVLALLDGPNPSLRGDQVATNLMVVKSLHPDWFQGDSLYGFVRIWSQSGWSLWRRAEAPGGA